MKLWNTENNIDALIEKFTIGQDQILDLELAQFDILGSKAHASMLASVGLISIKEKTELLTELDIISQKIDQGDFVIEPGVEDVHSQVEKMLIEKLGAPGKKLHTGRSRNDQVLLDLRLYFRHKLDSLSTKTQSLVHLFINNSESTKDFLMPGYTHMQVGMVSSFGLWYGSYGEALIEDYQQLTTTRTAINQNPLGSAAGYGSSFALDRKKTTELLQFDDLCYNSMYAQFGRGKTELKVAQAISSLAYTLAKFAMDVCLYSNQNYNLLTLPDSIVTGSSIMPHKRNPDLFELIRAKCNQLMSLPTQILMICQNLPSGYHRDFQQIKEIIMPAIAVIENILEIILHVLPQIKVNENALEGDQYDLLYSVEEINLRIQQGLPFREAYHEVKKDINEGKFKPRKNLKHTHLGSIGNLANLEIIRKLGKTI